ncbi:polymer-forming cytoskeletal protein [Nesterenkonia sp. YGD6]|uniref:polymer-forming cytoskeletal protein n=1 Tax=Nesterenkonia sp. YGD6 TaxID=2901231 RepID=UPI001F4CEE8C|nr:polymer-forming cytoskeletal protein [Nesterenkonia sp. YGD6]MCH8562896.1 polymer-forming cytoskeletal protein [Nesterenkonia sp. YGD6]
MTTVPTRRLFLSFLVLLWLGLFVTGCGISGETGRYSVTVINQHHHVVESGQTLIGNTVLIGGTLVLEEGAVHHGPVTVFAGDALISGQVMGDLTVLGGTAALTGTAEITGDVAAADGTLTRDAGTAVRGGITDEPNPVATLERSTQPRAPAERALWFLVGVTVMASLAWLTARLAPRPLRRAGTAATDFPVISGALGALVLVSALPLVVSMIFTLFLIPVAVIVLVGFGATVVYGLLATGRALGVRMIRRLGWALSPPRTAALGTAVLVVCLQTIGLVPFVGAAVTGIVIVVSVGAVFLTGFGLRGYRPPDDEIEEDSARGASA